MTEGSGVQQRRAATVEPTDADASDGAWTELSVPATPTTLARFAAPRAPNRTTLAVFSDPHLSTDKSGTWKAYHRTEARFRAAVADANDRAVDGVVVAGDLTEDGRLEDFDAVADVLADLDAPFVAVPGNHDVPKSFDDHDTPPVSEFEARFAPDSFPYRAELGDVDVLGLNSASTPDGELAGTHDGAVSEDQLAWLEETLPETEAAVVVSHHNPPGLESHLADDHYAPHPPVGDAPAFVDALAGHDALHLSGHVHLPAAISGDVRGLVCPALSSFPQAYVLVEVGPEGTTIRLVPVADPEGVAEAHDLARDHSDRSTDIAATVEDQLADLPLIDEQ
ncbi:metallophosphoesterase [Halorussus gelatinilyticus]|uniref:Metallophosphoesterase n=1 Tax=Halorussus gelatinilyticus TaxID=2937524 RepID=A0A8U0IJA0_9EURY|nr:metallophosphoesterase [Halorussus gelatinilyticus]UPW01103.1 metallophosphoesterase [Halorussus gelatinilyticus]